MRCWYFSEMAYHPAWDAGLARGSLRVVLPSSNFDPPTAHGLLNRYLDEFALCDEVGLDIMVNEHHSTATCMTVSVPMALAIIARETKRARLLSLGTPIANRPDPVRVAEEMAWLDVLSGGRLEMGLVKGAPYEIQPANSNPADADAPLLGGARPDPEGDVHARRPVQLGGRVLPLPQRQHLAEAGAAADAAGVDDRHERGYRHACGGTRPRGWNAAVRRHRQADVRRLSRSGRANSAGRRVRIAWPMPRSLASARRARRVCAAPIRSPIMCAPRRSWRSHSPIHLATIPSAPMWRS